jgi:hypothetical protein
MFEIHGNGSDLFWGEIPPSEHLVQIYDNDRIFIETLASFVAAGLTADESVIVIATPQHQVRLDDQLRARGLSAEAARATNLLVSLEADEVLSQFMVEGWPNEQLFNLVVRGLLGRARGTSGRKVRAFGEMVALLWARGNEGAAVRLEFLWTQLCNTEKFPLFCAYPRVGFTGNRTETITQLCELHTKVVSGDRSPSGIAPVSAPQSTHPQQTR